MKQFIYIAVACVAMIFAAGEANAQMSKRYYVNGGWQFNGTVDNPIASSAQGYGAYMEGG